MCYIFALTASLTFCFNPSGFTAQFCPLTDPDCKIYLQMDSEEPVFQWRSDPINLQHWVLLYLAERITESWLSRCDPTVSSLSGNFRHPHGHRAKLPPNAKVSYDLLFVFPVGYLNFLMIFVVVCSFLRYILRMMLSNTWGTSFLCFSNPPFLIVFMKMFSTAFVHLTVTIRSF